MQKTSNMKVYECEISVFQGLQMQENGLSKKVEKDPPPIFIYGIT